MALSERERRLIEVGRNDFLPVLIPGMRHVPLVVPYCRLCGQPAELSQRTRVDWYSMTIEAECCGKQQGRRVSLEEIKRIHDTGDKLWLVVGRGQSQTVEKHGGRIMVGGRSYRVSAPGTVKLR